MRRRTAVIVSGPPASGKTTLATALARSLNYAIVDLDTVTGPLTRAALGLATGDETAIDSPAGSELRAARYETLLDVAAANLDVGVGVVIAAPFTAERTSAELFGEVVRRLGADVMLLYIDARDEVVQQRLQSRNAPRDWSKLKGARAVASPSAVVPDAIVLDGTRSAADQLREALDALARLDRQHQDEPC